MIESASRRHLEERIRAGVLEQNTADLLTACGLGDRMRREGLIHCGIELQFQGRAHRVDFQALTGRSITVYGQHEVVKDLIQARLAAGGTIFFDVSNVTLHALDGPSPRVAFIQAGEPQQIECEYIAGCDGSHGICRPSIPAGALRVYEKHYPFAWLGILADAPPASQELVYVNHDRGFALLSMRSPSLSRLYLQCRPGEDLSQWPDSRIWEELQLRFETDSGFRLHEGAILQRGVTAMRSLVVEPMQYGPLFLAGDAAHIVPPTGAKGMNLAVADVRVLSHALSCRYRTGSSALLDRYSEICLRRVWRVQHFSWWMTALLHQFTDPFDQCRRAAELQQLITSRAAATVLAENYTGLPFDLPSEGTGPLS